MPRVLVAAVGLALLAVAAPVHATQCAPPWHAIDVAHTLERQGVGRGWKLEEAKDQHEYAASKSAHAAVLTFGCQGDYLDELEVEDAEVAAGKMKIVRFQNDAAFVIVAFYRPVTAAEAAVTRATLANLTP